MNHQDYVSHLKIIKVIDIDTRKTLKREKEQGKTKNAKKVKQRQ